MLHCRHVSLVSVGKFACKQSLSMHRFTLLLRMPTVGDLPTGKLKRAPCIRHNTVCGAPLRSSCNAGDEPAADQTPIRTHSKQDSPLLQRRQLLQHASLVTAAATVLRPGVCSARVYDRPTNLTSLLCECQIGSPQTFCILQHSLHRLT